MSNQTKERISVEATALTQDQLKDIAARDAIGEAHKEESELLRSDGYVEDWNDVLSELMSDLYAEKEERRSQLELYKSTGPGRQEFYEFKAQYGAWKAGMARMLSTYGSRKHEAQRLIRDLKQRRHAVHQEHQKEVSATKKLARTQEALEGQREERQAFRNLLVDIQKQLLEIDEVFRPEMLPLRDRLLARVEETIYAPASGRGESAS